MLQATMGQVLECLPVLLSGGSQQNWSPMASQESLKPPMSATKSMGFLLALDRGGVGEEVPVPVFLKYSPSFILIRISWIQW